MLASEIMEKVKSALDISKGDGMSGIGVDQTALLENPEFKDQVENTVEGKPISEYASIRSSTLPPAALECCAFSYQHNRSVVCPHWLMDLQPQDPRDLNTSGGPNYGRMSKTEDHKSSLLNKLDPRIGYTEKDINDSVTSYEAKYGKPHEPELPVGEYPGSKMSGMGTDQSSLAQPQQTPQDAEGHF